MFFITKKKIKKNLMNCDTKLQADFIAAVFTQFLQRGVISVASSKFQRKLNVSCFRQPILAVHVYIVIGEK